MKRPVVVARPFRSAMLLVVDKGSPIQVTVKLAISAASGEAAHACI
jgi:hypothetical protein